MNQPSIGPRPETERQPPDHQEPIDSRGLPGGYLARPMTLSDVEAVHTLESRLFPDDAWPVDMFLAELCHPVRRYTVVEFDGCVVAYAGMMAVAETGDVQTIAVAPEHEGLGIGRWLMARMHHQAVRAGAQVMMLEVRADNHRAQRLYESMGYSSIHRRRGYYAGGCDAIIMQLDLHGPSATTTKEAPDANR
ncbi:ribosomal protein S18-alanine N-acetyltransferase [uncultured Kocuria sp.]|uniref:ribosomal protein S18-alanine N-acetyltransferase n=1 Tax=uncultured Kocuria sp. TaxID=259305 RepID=UPI0025991AA0|nr:ribosomal protein S18-alanine N-acetyltransferase [uncultured Kocuria sp.]MCT1367270.1 ribosomal protein S18-alanine N-acetyltransferase [Rothia sp. p3-SID1597]